MNSEIYSQTCDYMLHCHCGNLVVTAETKKIDSSLPFKTFTDVVDHIVIGTVIQEVKTSNISREVWH